MPAPPATERFAGVIFDLDGVLVESEHLWEANWVAFAARHGTVWTAADTATCQGMSSREWSAYLAAKTGQADPAAVADEVVGSMVRALAAGEVAFLPGAAALVREVADRVPVAVASSASRPFIVAVLAAAGVAGRFAAVVSSEEVPRGKPAPDVYAEAARRAGMAPRRCAAVEDSGVGIRAAAAAGLTVVAIPPRGYPPGRGALALAAAAVPDADAARRWLLARLPV